MSQQSLGSLAAPLFRLGEWKDGATLADGRFPLIALSHGTGGSADIMAWLGRGLASRGYIVAAVNHPGNNALEPYTPEGFLLWWERARDLTTMIDMVLAAREFESHVDSNRIGAAGFSLGGYTMMEIAGARTDLSRFQEFCRSSEAGGCMDPPEFPGLFARWTELAAGDPAFRAALAEAGRSYRDDRVDAVFAIAPALGPSLIPESLQGVTIPVAIVAGAEDHIVPIRDNAGRLARLIPGAVVTRFAGAGHYTFLAMCTDAGRQAQPELCGDVAGLNREAVHQSTLDHAVRFFEEAMNR